MSRELELVVHGKALNGWVMVCDGCWTTRSDVRPTQHDLPLDEFADAGWFIGEVSDRCPTCVAKAGGLDAVARTVRPLPRLSHRFAPLPVQIPADSPAAADSGTPASPRRTVTDGTTDSVAIHRSAQQETNSAPDATAGDGMRDDLDRYIAEAPPELRTAVAFVELREALARQLWEQEDRPEEWWADEEEREAYRDPIDAVLALPALRDVLAAAARDAERVTKVRELAETWSRLGPYAPTAVDSWRRDGLKQAADDVRRALDGTS